MGYGWPPHLNILISQDTLYGHTVQSHGQVNLVVNPGVLTQSATLTTCML